ncbi:16S rRNA (guanine(966)-N(2))-methyltransferase RsmD [Ramlibacter rhizophilus]|uniref:16S rRNA (Guanine(966)-N(2))-methyltransferase RsmD n=1 Tax=Ramlibacter rhizophilus TaxID=1781167 RepID=A0A4Z0BSW1_9BURK|nr:16S rRNA (guanine(966)-N(2))-methyltransferase RsmD [Ramlibacter rhizophilus]TFZ01125.1 16S rRNA (guanine(966)-N(2))-methyltransferase RsmD [Ramlibacter rhizophilus]
MATSPSRPASRPRPGVAGARLPQEVRIIGGLWKRTRLPVADRPGLRPTPDRVRETLFNWLGQDLAGWQVVDAFAGSGVLGLEAASRGAQHVLLVEQEPQQVDSLRALVQRLQAQAQVQVQRGNALTVLQGLPARSQDLVLLDPPFDAPLHEKALAAAAPALRSEGWLYLEAPTAWTEAQLAPLGLQPHRYLRAGAVHAHLLRLAVRPS